MSQYRTQPDDVTHEQAETDNHDGNSERDEQFNGRITIPHHISPQPFQVPRQEEEMQQIEHHRRHNELNELPFQDLPQPVKGIVIVAQA